MELKYRNIPWKKRCLITLFKSRGLRALTHFVQYSKLQKMYFKGMINIQVFILIFPSCSTTSGVGVRLSCNMLHN